jgi:hypothetical protein
MKKLLITFTILSFLPAVISAQLWELRKLEISGGIGTTQFFGDIGGYPNSKNILGIRDFTFKNTRYNLTTNLRYRIDDDFSIRVNLMGGLFHSTDARGSHITRAFEEKTVFFEPSLLAEYYVIKNQHENSFLFMRNRETFIKSVFKSLDFYVFAGLGGLAYHVEPNKVLSRFVAKTNGFTEVIPLGVGVNMIYSADINFGVELGGRITYSDNLDGYQANSMSNDVYHILTFSIIYKIKTAKKQMAGIRR